MFSWHCGGNSPALLPATGEIFSFPWKSSHATQLYPNVARSVDRSAKCNCLSVLQSRCGEGLQEKRVVERARSADPPHLLGSGSRCPARCRTQHDGVWTESLQCSQMVSSAGKGPAFTPNPSLYVASILLAIKAIQNQLNQKHQQSTKVFIKQDLTFCFFVFISFSRFYFTRFQRLAQYKMQYSVAAAGSAGIFMWLASSL